MSLIQRSIQCKKDETINYKLYRTWLIFRIGGGWVSSTYWLSKVTRGSACTFKHQNELSFEMLTIHCFSSFWVSLYGDVCRMMTNHFRVSHWDEMFTSFLWCVVMNPTFFTFIVLPFCIVILLWLDSSLFWGCETTCVVMEEQIFVETKFKNKTYGKTQKLIVQVQDRCC